MSRRFLVTSFVSLLSFFPLPGSAQNLIIPQIADGGGWQTTLVITNVTAAGTTASISFFQETGGSGATQPWNLGFLETASTQSLILAPGNSLFLHTPGTAATTTVGWAQLQANPALAAYAIFTQRVIGRTDQDGTANAAASATRVLVPFDNTKNFVTSVAVANPTGATESITVGIQLDAGGSSIATPISLPAQGHKAFTVPQQFTSTAGQSGLLEFYSATGSISVLALRFNPTGSFTTAPVYPETGSPIIQGSSQPSSIAISSSALGIGSLLITFPMANGTYSSGSVEGTLTNPAGTYNVTWNSVTVSGQTITFNGFQTSLSTMRAINGSPANITTGTLTLTLSGSGSSGTVTGSLNLVSTVATVSGSFTGTFSTQSAASSSPASITFYVAQNGNDSWSGLLPAPNAGNTDGPFASLDHARAAIQPVSKAGTAQVNVQIRAGTYYLPATEMLTAADSGSATTPVVYQNYPGESPVISGGMRVQGWANTGGNTWKAALSASTQYFENLYYNGTRRLRPRLGGSLGTYYRVAGTVYLSGAGAPPPPATAPNANCSIYVTGSGWECFDRFQYAPADPIAGTWKNLAPMSGNPCGQPAGNAALAGDVELLIFEKFEAAKLRINCVDTTSHVVYLTGPTVINSAFSSALGFIPQHRYLVENVEDALAQPGQWFLDRSATPWTLTYLAQPGENPNTDSVVIPQLTQVLVGSQLQYVTFQGLTFEHDNYTVPAEGEDPDLKLDVSAAVSFQNSQHITFDSGSVAHTAGTGLDFVSCTSTKSPSWCVSTIATAVTANNMAVNSAFYDVAATAIRVGLPGSAADSDANIPQFTTVENNVVEGWGRVFPGSYGITQGQAHDNTYTHNEIYDGYRAAVGICFCSGFKPDSHDNVISFNHAYNLLQGIMNDDGSLYIQARNSTGASPPGNKIVNNKVHDVSDASALDQDGYGGDGIYIDTETGLVDVENNLVYRVSGSPMQFAGAPQNPNEASTIKNNIFAFGRSAMVSEANPFTLGVPTSPITIFNLTNNLFYLDRSAASSPSFYLQGGCTYSAGFPFTVWEQWNSNLYWRADGGFATDPQAFHVQPTVVSQSNLCFGAAAETKWTSYTFAGWQATGEDTQSIVQDPHFRNPVYPADDYSLPGGSPGVGFVLFDPSQAGRSNPVIMPPAIPATFPTKTFNPLTDY